MFLALNISFLRIILYQQHYHLSLIGSAYPRQLTNRILIRVWLLDRLCSYGTTESIIPVMIALEYCGAHASDEAVPSQWATLPQHWLLEKFPTSLAPRMLLNCIYGRNYDTFSFLWARGLRFENERETFGQIDRLLSERMSIAHILKLIFRTLQILSVLLESAPPHAHEGVNFLPWLILSCFAGHPRYDN